MTWQEQERHTKVETLVPPPQPATIYQAAQLHGIKALIKFQVVIYGSCCKGLPQKLYCLFNSPLQRLIYQNLILVFKNT